MRALVVAATLAVGVHATSGDAGARAGSARTEAGGSPVAPAPVDVFATPAPALEGERIEFHGRVTEGIVGRLTLEVRRDHAWVLVDSARARRSGRFRLHGIAPRASRAATSQDAVRSARNVGLEAHLWVANAESTMRRALAMGPDGLLTDFPDQLVHVLDPPEPAG
jgi:hypothetical protein